MKRILTPLRLSLLLCLLLIAALLVACGGGSDNGEETTTSPAADDCTHQSSAWVTDREATCTAEGARILQCTSCKKTLDTQALPKIAHVEIGRASCRERVCRMV